MKIATDIVDHIRYAAVMDDKKLHALYARPDDQRPWSGDRFIGRVTRYAPEQRAYFLDLGDGVKAFMPHKDGKAFSPSSAIRVRIERPATKEKDIRCLFIEETSGHLGRVAFGPDVEEQAQADYPNAIPNKDGLQDFDTAIIALRDKAVSVQNGLELVIEHTAAFTAIDINNADPDLKPFEANRLCMMELMRQMRLRNLSGQILIDCLRLQNPEQRNRLHEVILEETKNDPRKVDLYGFTRLGLFELTRERNGLSLNDVLQLV